MFDYSKSKTWKINNKGRGGWNKDRRGRMGSGQFFER